MSHRQGLYDESFERDACGIGLIANGQRAADRSIVTGALTTLSRLAHRSALGADGKTSDGAGILLQIPDAFFRRKMGLPLPQRGSYAVAQIFVPQAAFDLDQMRTRFADKARELGVPVLAWRRVPVLPDCLGLQAKLIEPETHQAFLDTSSCKQENLYRLRRWAEQTFRRHSGCRDPQTGETLSQFYICSLST